MGAGARAGLGAAFLFASVWLSPLAPAVAEQAEVSQEGPQPGRVYRIGIITYASPGLEKPLKAALERMGYEERRNVVYEMKAAERDFSVMDRYAEELVAWKPDVIISLMTNAHVAVQRATAADPIPVVLWSADPLETGVIESFRRPGTNFTGFSYEPHAEALQIRLLKRAIPNLACIGHLYNPTYAPAPSTMRRLRQEGALMNTPVNVYEVRKKDQFEAVIARIRKDGCAGFVVGPHELFNGNGELIGQLALKYKLAAVSIQTSITHAGGLAAYSPPFEKGWPAMAPVVDRLLHGADPAEIPIERGFKSPLTINLNAARELGLKLPADLIDEADHVIE